MCLAKSVETSPHEPNLPRSSLVPVPRTPLALGAQMGDSRVAFAPEVNGHSSRSSPKSTPRGNVPDNWGFRFVVDPLHGVHYRVVRELELVCRFGGGAGGGSGSATKVSSCGKQVMRVLGDQTRRCLGAFLVI